MHFRNNTRFPASVHPHGVTLLHNGNRLDVAEVLPAATKTFDLTADNPGTWMFHCHVNDHLDAGMMTTFTIQGERSNEGDDEDNDEGDETFGRVRSGIQAFIFELVSSLGAVSTIPNNGK